MPLQHPSVYTARRVQEMRAQQNMSLSGKRFTIGATNALSSIGYTNSRGVVIQRGMRGVVREAAYSPAGEARLA